MAETADSVKLLIFKGKLYEIFGDVYNKCKHGEHKTQWNITLVETEAEHAKITRTQTLLKIYPLIVNTIQERVKICKTDAMLSVGVFKKELILEELEPLVKKGYEVGVTSYATSSEIYVKW